MQVAFIGLGRMGLPMALRLTAAGYSLALYSRTLKSTSDRDSFSSLAATWHNTVGEAVRDAKAVITIVGGPEDVAQLYRESILPVAAHGTLLIDMTTSSPRLATALANEAILLGCDMVDAPVTGGVTGARDGKLSILAGGDGNAIDRARALLAPLGSLTHCGPCGAGQRMKLVNQTMVAGVIAGLAEGVALARAGGLRAKTVNAALGSGTAGGLLFKAYVAKMFAHDYGATFSIAHFTKDLRLALAEAQSLNIDPAALVATLAQFERLVDAGHGELGIQTLVSHYQGNPSS